MTATHTHPRSRRFFSSRDTKNSTLLHTLTTHCANNTHDHLPTDRRRVRARRVDRREEDHVSAQDGAVRSTHRATAPPNRYDRPAALRSAPHPPPRSPTVLAQPTHPRPHTNHIHTTEPRSRRSARSSRQAALRRCAGTCCRCGAVRCGAVEGAASFSLAATEESGGPAIS